MASDGLIGDQAHAGSASDHNPNALGVVTAFDFTHDPKNGLDAHKIADRLIKSPRHPDAKYIISNRRIAGTHNGWKWQSYSGSNPHDKHVHVSVGVGPDGSSRQPYDDTVKWNIKGEDVYTGRFENKTQTKSAKGWYDRAVHYRKRTLAEVAEVAKLKKQLAGDSKVASIKAKISDFVKKVTP